MALEVASKRFRYGQHDIPLGEPYAYRVDADDHSVYLYSFGGMGLDSSKIHQVTFQFPAETAEKADRIVQQLFQHTGPLDKGTYRNETSSILCAYGKSKAYQLTQEKVFRATSLSHDSLRVGDVVIKNEKYEFGCDLMEDVSEPVKILGTIKERVDILLDKQPDLKDYFLPFTQQLSMMLTCKKASAFEFEILGNAMEITKLKYRLSKKEWNSLNAFICSGRGNASQVVLRLAPPPPKNQIKSPCHQ